MTKKELKELARQLGKNGGYAKQGVRKRARTKAAKALGRLGGLKSGGPRQNTGAPRQTNRCPCGTNTLHRARLRSFDCCKAAGIDEKTLGSARERDLKEQKLLKRSPLEYVVRLVDGEWKPVRLNDRHRAKPGEKVYRNYTDAYKNARARSG
jgi:hypothetical protein